MAVVSVCYILALKERGCINLWFFVSDRPRQPNAKSALFQGILLYRCFAHLNRQTFSIRSARHKACQSSAQVNLKFKKRVNILPVVSVALRRRRVADISSIQAEVAA